MLSDFESFFFFDDQVKQIQSDTCMQKERNGGRQRGRGEGEERGRGEGKVRVLLCIIKILASSSGFSTRRLDITFFSTCHSNPFHQTRKLKEAV